MKTPMLLPLALAVTLATFVGAAYSQGQSKTPGSSVSGTATITAPARPATLQSGRSGGQDAQITGGSSVALPGQDLPLPATSGGWNLPLVTVNAGGYEAFSEYQHDVGASFTLTVTPAGACSVVTSALKRVPQNETFDCGSWLPSGGVASDYLVQITPSISLVDCSGVSGGSTDFSVCKAGNIPQNATGMTYSPGTGWLALSSNFSVKASTGHIVGGSFDNDGWQHLYGTYTLSVKRKSDSTVWTYPFDFKLEADSGM